MTGPEFLSSRPHLGAKPSSRRARPAKMNRSRSKKIRRRYFDDSRSAHELSWPAVLLGHTSQRSTGVSILGLLSRNYPPCFTSCLTEIPCVTESVTRKDL